MLLVSCAKPVPRPAPRHAEVPTAKPGGEVIDLEIEGERPAVVSVPPGARGPLLVAAHGAGDRAEEHCAWWRDLVGARGFVLCPRGIPMTRAPDSGWFYRDHHRLEGEVLAAVDAFHARFPEADRGPAIYAGYSQGAIMGALFTARRPDRFSRLLLVEGGASEWDVPTATRFREGGGKRVAFVCGQSHCARDATRSLEWIRRVGLSGRREYTAGAGHVFGGPLNDAIRDAFEWLIADDPRWR